MAAKKKAAKKKAAAKAPAAVAADVERVSHPTLGNGRVIARDGDRVEVKFHRPRGKWARKTVPASELTAR